MKKSAFFLSILLLVASCQTKKHFAKSETEIKTASVLNITKEEVAKTDTQAVSTLAGSITETDSKVIEETITELSKPDSLGVQHTEKIINRKITSGKNKETKVVETAQLDQASENKVVETENQVTEQQLSNETKVKTIVRKFQSWKLIAAVIVLAGIAFLAWSRFFRRLTNKFNLL